MDSITKVTENSSTGIVVDSEAGSISNSTIVVPFHGTELLLVPFNGEPYVPMKPVVEGMGLAWQSQLEKIKSKFSKGITEIVIPSVGGNQLTTCLSLKKLPAWLYSIQLGKIKDPTVRDKVETYQNESDEVLWQYWTKGSVTKESVAKATQPKRESPFKSFLPEFRMSRALKMQIESMDVALRHLPHLSEESKQVCFAKIFNDVTGSEIIPLPLIEEHYHTATEVGNMLGCSANKIGKVANEHNLKTEEYGKFFLDKSPFSNKQVEAFRYNANGVSALKHIIVGEDAA